MRILFMVMLYLIGIKVMVALYWLIMYWLGGLFHAL
jgi:hypothetical protein